MRCICFLKRVPPGLWVVVLALSVRFVVLVALWQSVGVSSDFREDFWPLAVSVAEGRGFSLHGHPSAIYPPGYPLLLAGVYGVFGASAVAFRMTLTAVDVLLCWLAYRLGRELFDRMTGFVAGVGMALCPYFLYLILRLASDGLFTFGCLLFIFFLVRGVRNRRWSTFALAGFTAGIATLIRAPSLLLPLWCIPFIWWSFRPGGRSRKLLGQIALSIGIFGAVLMPWTVRNFIHFDRLIPIQVLGGHLVYASTRSTQDAESWRSDKEAIRKADDAVGRDDSYYIVAIRNISSNPGAFAVSMVRRLGTMWYRTSAGAHDEKLRVANSLLLGLAAFGLWVQRRRWRELLIPVGAVMYFVAIHSVIFPIFRYLMPVVPLLILFASAAVTHVVRSLAPEPSPTVDGSTES